MAILGRAALGNEYSRRGMGDRFHRQATLPHSSYKLLRNLYTLCFPSFPFSFSPDVRKDARIVSSDAPTTSRGRLLGLALLHRRGNSGSRTAGTPAHICRTSTLGTAPLAAIPSAPSALQWRSMPSPREAGEDRTSEPEEEPKLSLAQASGVSAADSSTFALGLDALSTPAHSDGPQGFLRVAREESHLRMTPFTLRAP